VASLAAARTAREEGESLKDNAWFVGLAPRRNPEIVVVVLYQSGEHGSLAAPLARDVIKAHFDKKKRIQPQLANREEPGPRPAAALAPSGRIGG
jgi:penicillin-binding protein 2